MNLETNNTETKAIININESVKLNNVKRFTNIWCIEGLRNHNTPFLCTKMDTVKELEKEQPFRTESSLWVWANTVAKEENVSIGSVGLVPRTKTSFFHLIVVALWFFRDRGNWTGTWRIGERKSRANKKGKRQRAEKEERVFKLKIMDSVKVNPYGIYELINDTQINFIMQSPRSSQIME